MSVKYISEDDHTVTNKTHHQIELGQAMLPRVQGLD